MVKPAAWRECNATANGDGDGDGEDDDDDGGVEDREIYTMLVRIWKKKGLKSQEPSSNSILWQVENK